MRPTESTTVGEILKQWPDTLVLFGRYSLDTCCGAKLTLRDAAASQGVDLQQLLQELEQYTGK